jgi:DNA processing protein
MDKQIQLSDFNLEISIETTNILKTIFANKEIFPISIKKFQSLASISDTKEKKNENKNENNNEVCNFIDILRGEDIGVLSFKDKYYPKSFHALAENSRPVLIFYQGNLESLSLFDQKTVGVVGSRELDDYSKKCINKFLKKDQRIVVSGLAKGVDGYSQLQALENNLPCISVIAGGLDDKSFYPKENLGLKNCIIKSGGIVISEYPPFYEPKRAYFIERNRLISALSDSLVVIKASLKSGSLSTAKKSLKLNKQVLTPPFSLFHKDSEGYNGNLWLLENGAKILNIGIEKEIVKNEDQDLKISYKKNTNASIKIIIEEKGNTLDEIEELNQDKNFDIQQELFELEMNGQVELKGGIYKVRV